MPEDAPFDGEIDSTIEAFDAFVRATPDDAAHTVRAGSVLNGAQLHFVRRALEDMLVDYEAAFTPGEFEADRANPLDR